MLNADLQETTSAIGVAFTPEEIQGIALDGYRVVVLDVLRATSAVCAGLHAGVQCFRPVLTVQESLALSQQGYIPAAERDGLVLPGFDVGNSPLVFREPRFKGKKIALTTTNGTRALWAARNSGAEEILAGSFLGLSVMIRELLRQPRPTLLLCSGWQGKFSWEDTLLAGAVAHGVLALENSGNRPQLQSEPVLYKAQDDRVQAALSLWLQHRHDLLSAIRLSSHFQRLSSAGLKEDIAFCAEMDACPVYGRLVGEDLVLV
jgi:2-phosphosulfolactate phosphatase